MWMLSKSGTASGQDLVDMRYSAALGDEPAVEYHLREA